MALTKKDKQRAARRKLRVRDRLKSYGMASRVTVHRTLHHIYAQIINDAEQKTIVSCSTLELKEVAGDKKNKARAVGLELAKKAQEKGVESVVFDRGKFLYHGRVKALAEGLREGGLKF